MSMAINAAQIYQSIAQRAQAMNTINSTNEAMMGLAGNMEQRARFGAALEMQGQQARMMYQVSQLIQEEAQKQMAKDIKLTFGNPFNA